MDLIKYRLYQDKTYKTLWMYVGIDTKHPIFHDECYLHKFIGVSFFNVGLPRYEEDKQHCLNNMFDGPYEAALGDKLIAPY